MLEAMNKRESMAKMPVKATTGGNETASLGVTANKKDGDDYHQKMSAAPKYVPPIACKTCIENKQDPTTYLHQAHGWQSDLVLHITKKILDSKQKWHTHTPQDGLSRIWTCNQGHTWTEYEKQSASCFCGWPVDHSYWKTTDIVSVADARQVYDEVRS
jgi:hypothetical protein